MKTGEVKVYYKQGCLINEQLDTHIKDTLLRFNLRCWATGFNFETGVRDLSFDDFDKGEDK